MPRMGAVPMPFAPTCSACVGDSCDEVNRNGKRGEGTAEDGQGGGSNGSASGRFQWPFEPATPVMFGHASG